MPKGATSRIIVAGLVRRRGVMSATTASTAVNHGPDAAMSGFISRNR